MPKQHDYAFNEDELKQLRQVMKHQDARVAKRATIIDGLHLGNFLWGIAHPDA